MAEAGRLTRRAERALDPVTTRSTQGWRGDRWRSDGLGVDVTTDRAPGAQGEYAGQGNRGRERIAEPCVGEAVDGRWRGGVRQRHGVRGEGRGMFLRLRGKEKTMRRDHIQVNRVRGGAHLRPGKAVMFRLKTGEAARHWW
jgi:hypothetical protein